MNKNNTIQTIWTAMDGEKGDLVLRCEQYARWTIRGICPEEFVEGQELMHSYVVIGPRLVNNLSNKVVEAMFPHTRPFFSVNMSMEVQKKIRQEAGEEALAQIASDARKEARWVEDYAMSKMNLVKYRPIAVEVAQHLIVTGNALKRRMPNGRNVVYGVRDFGIRRDITGEPRECVVRDQVMFDELPDLVKEAIKAERPATAKPSVGSTAPTHKADKLWLYTRFWKEGNRWISEQECEGYLIQNSRMGYSMRDVPITALTWSLPRGYNYGRGLVEEHAVVFHNLDKTGEALFDIFQISADIKFVVNPASLLDVVALNNSRRGSFHSGMPEDVGALSNDKAKELNVLAAAVERMERELSLVFLMGTGAVRDAERVTAYEVQLNALELETAFGGLYSRLALDWQQAEAEYLVGQLKIPSLDKKELFDITITTGMENLSREGALQNFRAAIMDLQLLEGVPEDIRQGINPLKVAAFLFGQRGVKFEEFMFSQAEIQANQQANQKAEQDMMAAEAASKVAAQPTE